MEITQTLYVAERETWRDWLAEHYADAEEIWLISYRVHADKPNLPYNHAVEEALCFGWIDSTRKSLDADRYVQRFSPRRPGSAFSQTNQERLARLVAQGKVIAPVLESVRDIDPAAYMIPADILTALQAEPTAWAFFQRTSPAYRRIRAAYVDHGRRRPGEFEKRLANLVKQCAAGKQFGYGIEEYY